MTDTIEQKALALVNEVETERGMSEWTDVCRSELTMGEALCRAIEAHEAFRQEVSDAVEAVFAGYHDAPIPWVIMRRKLERFIIAKPDPLVEVLDEALWDVAQVKLSDRELADVAARLAIVAKEKA